MKKKKFHDIVSELLEEPKEPVKTIRDLGQTVRKEIYANR